nr:MAG TPA: hypothetical protein [Caudoviricetes sp.]
MLFLPAVLAIIYQATTVEEIEPLKNFKVLV